MPELPEVQTVLNQISPHILNTEIIAIEVTPAGLRLIYPQTLQSFSEGVLGRKISTAERFGKFMCFGLDDGKSIVAHLRMSGRFVITRKPSQHKHNRLWLKFKNGKILNFIDIRRFATFELVDADSEHAGLQKLGPDALDANLNATLLASKLKDRKKPIYSALLDQSLIAGLGNIYVNEVLYASGISPLRPAGEITLIEAGVILREARRILQMAINYRGTTLIDKSYANPDGNYGDFFKELKVYGRADKKNPDGWTVQRLKIGGRSVFWVPEKQK